MALSFKKIIQTSAVSLLAATALGAPAFATEGYFQNGSSARSKALAGAGLADTRDAGGIGLNPAGLFGAGNQFQVALSLFNPNRKFTGSGAMGFTPSGVVESGNNWFPVPSLAYSRQVNDQFAYGLAVVANGGMNTSYSKTQPNPICGFGPFPSTTGVFCGNGAGVDLNQVFIQPTFAYRPTSGISFGITPIYAIQKFKARGLAIFGDLSVDPANLTDNGSSWSTGLGVKAGVEIDAGNGFRMAGTIQPKINMSRFDKYRGLFADGGDFDIPSNWSVGLAWDLREDVTAMFDIRKVNYSGVGSIGNSTTTPNFFGNFGGPGFGWDDVTAYKFGVEWRRDEFTWRAGYAWNNNPIGPEDVTLNLLAPGVITSHITGGFSIDVNESNSFDFALMYAPTSSVSGPEAIPGGPPGQIIELSMNQLELTFGWTFKFGN